MVNKLNNPRLSPNRSVILHLYSLGYRCAAEIARRTKLPVPTIKYNVVKIRHQDNVKHRGGNGRHARFQRKSIFQLVRRSEEIKKLL